MKPAHWMLIGALSAAVAVALGAVGAHGVRGWLNENFDPDTAAKRLANWQTAAAYHRFHALGLLVTGFATTRIRSRMLHAAGWLMIVGMTLFSGLLYVYSITGSAWMGPVFPIGGFSYIAAWLLLAAAIWKHGDGQATNAAHLQDERSR